MFPWFWNSSLSWPRSNHRYLRKLGCVSRDISKIYNGIWMHGTECNPSSTFELWQQSKSEKLQSDIFYKKNQLAYDRTFCMTFQHVIWHSVWSALSNNLQLYLEAVCWNNSIFSKTNICLFSREKYPQCKWISCCWAGWVLIEQKHWIHLFSLLPCACLHSSSSSITWYVPLANLFILLLCWLLMHFFRTTILHGPFISPTPVWLHRAA